MPNRQRWVARKAVVRVGAGAALEDAAAPARLLAAVATVRAETELGASLQLRGFHHLASLTPDPDGTRPAGEPAPR